VYTVSFTGALSAVVLLLPLAFQSTSDLKQLAILIKSFKASCMQMYDNLDWPVAVQDLIQAAEYLSGTGSPKVCFELTSIQDMLLAPCKPHFLSTDLQNALFHTC